MILPINSSRSLIVPRTPTPTDPPPLVPKLCLGTHRPEALLRGGNPGRRWHLLTASLFDEAELRGLAFPSRAWERGARRGQGRFIVLYCNSFFHPYFRGNDLLRPRVWGHN